MSSVSVLRCLMISFKIFHPCRTLFEESTCHFGQTWHCLCGWEPACERHHHAEPCACSCHLEKVSSSDTLQVWCKNNTSCNTSVCKKTKCKTGTEVVRKPVLNWWVLNLCLNTETASEVQEAHFKHRNPCRRSVSRAGAQLVFIPFLFSSGTVS